MAPRLLGHSSGEVFAGDGAGLRSGGGLGVGTAMSLLGGGSVPDLSRGSSGGGGLRSGSGSGGGRSGSESGDGARGEIFLKSAGGGVSEGKLPFSYFGRLVKKGNLAVKTATPNM